MSIPDSLSPKFLSVDDALEIFEYTMGQTPTVVNLPQLVSAIEQPKASFSGALLHSTIPEQAAAYLFHIAMNHPLLDGNKRLALLCMDTFLRINGYHLTLTPDGLYELVIGVVTKRIDKTELAKVIAVHTTCD